MPVTKTYNLNITQDSDERCLNTMKAITAIMKKLSYSDIQLLAKAIQEKPEFINTARAALT
jgi:hypothetical protein